MAQPLRILIVEDEGHLADGLRFNLEAEGYETEIVADGEAAVTLLADANFDAVVLDVMLPKKTGFEVAAEMREGGDYTPVLMLTALGRPEEVLKGFEAGADDYLPKPFDLDIFLARLNGLLRRSKWSKNERRAERRDVLTINGREVDLGNLELRYKGDTTPLTLMEAKLLRYLIDHAGHAVSRKAILEDVWQLQEDTDTRAIDNFVVRLRKIIEDTPTDPKILVTVRGIGYKFIPD